MVIKKQIVTRSSQKTTPLYQDKWGVISPVRFESSRVRLDLGLARAARYFNDLTFPGLGGVSFIRQLTWSVMGIKLRDDLDQSAMQLAEAIEALAAYIAIHHSNKVYDYNRRIRGQRKLGDKNHDYSYLRLKTRYVSQPFRMGTGAALVGLGLASGSQTRFNGLELTSPGLQLAEIHLSRPISERQTVRDWLMQWVMGSKKSIPDDLKFTLLPGILGKKDGIPTKYEAKLVKKLLLDNPQRSFVWNSLIANKNYFTGNGDGPLINTLDGQKQFLKTIEDSGQRKRMDAAFHFQRMCQLALNLLGSIGANINEHRRKGLNHNLSLDDLALQNKNKLENLGIASKCFLNTMKVAQIEQQDAQMFVVAQQDSFEQRLKDLIIRSKDYLTMIGGNADLGRLYKNEVRFFDPDDQSEEDETAEVVPVRLWRAYRLMCDIEGAIV